MAEQRHWSESFHIVTPILLLSLNVLAGVLMTNQNELKCVVKEMDNKVFIHLTNAQIHIPRETVVSKDEFLLYQDMRDKQINDIKERLIDIHSFLKSKFSK